MSDKPRNMTEKGFLHKCTTKAANAAGAFIAAYRDWLTTGELASATNPILVRLDAGEVLPTPALEEIKDAVYNHWQLSEIRKGEEAMNKAASPADPKNWTCTIYDRNGKVCTRINSQGDEEDLIKGFTLAQDADRWTDKRLVDGPPDCFGVIQHATMVNRHGELLNTVVMRADAMARIFKAGKAPVMKVTSKTTSKLKFGVKASQDRCHFSKG